MYGLNDLEYYWEILLSNFDLYDEEDQEKMIIELIHKFMRTNKGITLKRLKEIVTKAFISYPIERVK